MHVVIPQDPFWAELWATIDDPLLYELGPQVNTPHEEPVVRNTYAAYGRILDKLPPGVRQLVFSYTSWRATAFPEQQEFPGQRRPAEEGAPLCRADGQPLTPMHVIDVADDDLVALVTFQLHLTSDELYDFGALVPQDLANVYHRALGVLTLIPPPGLQEALAAARGSGAEISLSADTQTAYDTHRDRIIQVVSGHNPVIMSCHRMLYT
ncbi:hypothetical protein OG232_04045 [Streptomyces sp. NBC_01411]|uniref:hypothetical protein n=1 Tax=Streptomyces sp. NBC_01411 TaxID=2903857 RepID=UPI00324FAD9F